MSRHRKINYHSLLNTSRLYKRQYHHSILSTRHLLNRPYFFQISIPVCIPPEGNLLSLDVIFFQTEPEILHQYPVFFRCQRNLLLALRHIQYERIVPFHIPNLPAKCQIAVILLLQIYNYIVVYLHKSIFDTLYEIIVSLCCCVHFYHPFIFIIMMWAYQAP